MRNQDSQPGHTDAVWDSCDLLPSGIVLFASDLQMIACDEPVTQLLDLPPAMIENRLPTLYELAIFNARRGDYGPGDPEMLAQQIVEHARKRQAHVYERTRPDGTVLEIRTTPLPENRGLVIIYSDITSRKRAGLCEQFRSHTLERLASGQPLNAILGAIVRGMEQLKPPMLCAILLLDGEGRHLRVGAAPSLPDCYSAAIDGAAIGLGIGSSGTAAFTGKRVIVEDIANHPYCSGRKELAARAGLNACWSQPIHASSGQILGTLTLYHPHPATPSAHDLFIMEQSAQLAGIAIERSTAVEKIHNSEALYRLLTEDTDDVVWKTDRHLRFTYISPADERLRGFRADEVIGTHALDMFTKKSAAVVRTIMRNRELTEKAGKQTNFITFEAEHHCKDGSLLWGEVKSKPERDADGNITGYHGITREITERKQMQDQVRKLALYDTLTSLPNRRLLNDRLEQAMTASHRSGCHAALIFLDLDNFKPLNDTHGHAVGDLLLCEAANRLKECVRDTDTVARFGGDEFVVILQNLPPDKSTSTSQVRIIAEKIRGTLSVPYQLAIKHDGMTDKVIVHHCTASLGVVMIINHTARRDDILRWADKAMYQAKDAGRNAICFHAPRR